MLGRGVEEALDVAAGREVLALGAQHDDAHARVFVERFEGEAQFVALRHGDDVHRRAVEHDVGALAGGVDRDAETVEIGQAGIWHGRALTEEEGEKGDAASSA